MAGDGKPRNQEGSESKTAEITKGTSADQVADMKILRTLAGYLWMRDNPEFRYRVIAALGLLVGAKVSDSLNMLVY